MKKFIFTLLSLFIAFYTPRTFAQLSAIGIGISRPSHSTHLFTRENPAASATYEGVGIHAAGHAAESDFDPSTYGAAVSWGNGQFGLTGGASQFSESDSNDPNIHWGLGAVVDSLNFSIGLSGTIVDTGSDTANSEDAGLLLRPFSALTIGVTAYDVFDEINLYGLGFAVEMSTEWMLSVDMLYNEESSARDYWGGLQYKASEKLEISGGVRYQDDGNGNDETDPFVGFGFRPIENLALQGQWQTFNEYLVSLSLLF